MADNSQPAYNLPTEDDASETDSQPPVIIEVSDDESEISLDLEEAVAIRPLPPRLAEAEASYFSYHLTAEFARLSMEVKSKPSLMTPLCASKL